MNRNTKRSIYQHGRSGPCSLEGTRSRSRCRLWCTFRRSCTGLARTRRLGRESSALPKFAPRKGEGEDRMFRGGEVRLTALAVWRLERRLALALVKRGIWGEHTFSSSAQTSLTNMWTWDNNTFLFVHYILSTYKNCEVFLSKPFSHLFPWNGLGQSHLNLLLPLSLHTPLLRQGFGSQRPDRWEALRVDQNL